MAVSVEGLNSTVPFVRYANPTAVKPDSTIQQDAARAAILANYTVMGKSLSAVPTTGTAVGTNTGNGTVTAVSKIQDGQAAIVGNYVLEVVGAVANGGVFKLTDPYGNILANAITMTPGAGAATIFEVAGFKFTITDGGTDFIVGDKFNIVVTAVNKWNPLKASKTDGAQSVGGVYIGGDILAATLIAGDVVNSAIITGDCYIDKNQLILEGGLTLDSILPSGKTVERELAQLGIMVEDTIDISHQE